MGHRVHTLFAILASGWGPVACGPGGTPPTLQPIAERQVAVGQELQLLLAATDPDGDVLDYSFESEVPGIDGRAIIGTLELGGGEFRWTPLASDVGVWPFQFTVSDGNHTDSARTRIDVRTAVGEGSAPHFVHPQGMGTTLNLDLAMCLDVLLEVIDGDSPDVVFGERPPAVEGGSLMQTGPLSATWTFCPSQEQIDTLDTVSITFFADDGDNPATELPYLVVLHQPISEAPGVVESRYDGIFSPRTRRHAAGVF